MQNTVQRVSILVAALLPVVVLGFFVMKPKDSPQSSTSVAAATVPLTAAASAFTFTNGTYSTTVSYSSPGGADSLGVSVTLKGDVIVDVAVTEMANDPASQTFQDAFVAGYKTFVVGKNIADVQLSKVSGSSLTSQAFNDALSAIKTQAEA